MVSFVVINGLTGPLGDAAKILASNELEQDIGVSIIAIAIAMASIVALAALAATGYSAARLFKHYFHKNEHLVDTAINLTATTSKF